MKSIRVKAYHCRLFIAHHNQIITHMYQLDCHRTRSQVTWLVKVKILSISLTELKLIAFVILFWANRLSISGDLRELATDEAETKCLGSERYESDGHHWLVLDGHCIARVSFVTEWMGLFHRLERERRRPPETRRGEREKRQRDEERKKCHGRHWPSSWREARRTPLNCDLPRTTVCFAHRPEQWVYGAIGFNCMYHWFAGKLKNRCREKRDRLIEGEGRREREKVEYNCSALLHWIIFRPRAETVSDRSQWSGNNTISTSIFTLSTV